MLETEYLGRKVRFNEAEDQWECHDFGLENASLKALKAAILKLDAESRRVGAFQAMYWPWASSSPKPCTVTLVADDRTSAWVVVDKRREKARISDLYWDSPENREIIAQAQRDREESRFLNDKAHKALSNMKKITLGDLLVRIPKP